MIIGISISWYEMPCTCGTAIDVIPKNVWFVLKEINNGII